MLLQVLAQLLCHLQNIKGYICGDLLVLAKVNDGFRAGEAAQQGGPPGGHGLPQCPSTLLQRLQRDT